MLRPSSSVSTRTSGQRSPKPFATSLRTCEVATSRTRTRPTPTPKGFWNSHFRRRRLGLSFPQAWGSAKYPALFSAEPDLVGPEGKEIGHEALCCLLYTSPSPRDRQ